MLRHRSLRSTVWLNMHAASFFPAESEIDANHFPTSPWTNITNPAVMHEMQFQHRSPDSAALGTTVRHQFGPLLNGKWSAPTDALPRQASRWTTPRSTAPHSESAHIS